MSDNYNKRTWLNPVASTSTGSVVCCHFPEENDRYGTFIEISDCRGKVTLHPAKSETLASFVAKMLLLRSEIDSFIKVLEADITDPSISTFEDFAEKNFEVKNG